MSLNGKVILVSGANRGIGAATVKALLGAGVKKVYATARRVESLPDFGDARVVPLQLDVVDDASVARAAETAADVDVLLNNAGTLTFADFLASPIADVEADMNTNYYGTLRVIRAFAPKLVAKGAGTIVNVVSVVGLVSAPPIGVYSASKAALQSLTQTLRTTLKPSGVTVLGIYPGPVDTDLAKGIPMDKATPDQVAAEIVAGLEKGETYIFPDATAKQIEHLWAHDGRQLEVAMASAA